MQSKSLNINFKTQEMSDSKSTKANRYVEEFKNFTPDFLAAASPHSNFKCM